MVSNHFNRSDYRETGFSSAADNSDDVTNIGERSALLNLHNEYWMRTGVMSGERNQGSLIRTDQAQSKSALDSLPEVTILESSFADLMAVIQSLQMEIAALKRQLAGGKGGPNDYVGNSGAELGGGKGGPDDYVGNSGPELGGGKGGPAIDDVSNGIANQSIRPSFDSESSFNGSPLQDPAQFFMTEMRNARWNPHGDLWSMNCGPATVATVIKGFGCKLTDSEDPQDLIVSARIAMTGRNAHEGTGANDVQRGLKAANLDTTAVTDVSQIDQALDAGGMVVLYGDPRQPGSYYNRMNNSVYGRITGAVTHWIPVVKRIDGGAGEDSYVVNDVLSRTGPIVISRSELTNFLLKTPLNGRPVYGVAAHK